MSRSLALGLILALGVSAAGTRAQLLGLPPPLPEIPVFPTAAVDRAVSKFMKTYELKGLVLGVLAGKEVVHEKGYGRLGVHAPVDLASISKSMTALLAMRLVEAGRIRLDDPVAAYLPGRGVDRRITLRQLLTHTSGLPHYGEDFPYREVFRMRQFQGLMPKTVPGAAWCYSSPAYFLLSRALMAANPPPNFRGAARLKIPSFFDLLNTWVAGPLEAGTFGEHPKHGHRLGAGGVTASLKTMNRIARALLNRKLLDEESYQEMWSPVRGEDGVENQGLGFFVHGARNPRVVHTGAHPDLHNYSRLDLKVGEGHGLFLMGKGSQKFSTRKLRDAVYRALDDAGYDYQNLDRKAD